MSWRIWLKNGYILILVLFLAGCLGKQQVKKDLYFHEQEARYSDIAIPFGAKAYGGNPVSSDDSVGTLMRFKTNKPYQELQKLYREEMERYGWKITAIAQSDETLYHCCKPTRWCSIVIHPVGRNCAVSIFVGSL